MTNETIAIQQPNATLYVSNIDWSIKKPMLRRALYSLFSRHGKILEVITLRKEGLRGQAWVMFDDVQAATKALQTEQGFHFFGRDLKIQYAHETSDRIAKRDGTYVPKAKRTKLTSSTVAPTTPSATTTTITEAPSTHVDMTMTTQQQQPPPPSSSSDTTTTALPPPPTTTTTAMEENSTTTTTTITENTTTPSHILFAQDLPSECNEMMLAMLFRQYKGYKETRIPRQGLAFVEFDDEPHATIALKALQGFKLTTNDTLTLKYGKA
eukprot:CAMPEP_0195297666 /NCGR_PEP_ID=MMETSP0707-20130614/21976_1 /TAXON_ID=33640 /ORGANISM="Asterionellopsis glacialis, Strain CCMP134" /LENGTH=266 /DNA_ID=CAMNT_0040359553 /DNA_START=42 /DNA_END=842 /DNA_ORIENTATION=+